MFCPNCGQPVNETEKFCQNCGAPIECPQPEPQPEESASEPIPEVFASEALSEAPEQPQIVPPTYTPPLFTPPAVPQSEQQEPAPQPEQSCAPKKSRKGLWIALACGALALIAAAVALFIWRPWKKTPEETLRAAFEKMQSIGSMHMDMTEDVSMELVLTEYDYRQSMDMQLVLSSDLQGEPKTSRSELNLRGGGISQSALIYTETIDGQSWSYTSADGGKTWTKQEVDEGMVVAPSDALTAFFKYARDFQEAGTDTVNGEKVTVYTGKMAGEYVGEALAMTGNENILSTMGLDSDELKENIDDINVLFCIDGSGRIVRINMDVKDMMQKLLSRAIESQAGASGDLGMEYNVNKASIDCVLSKFDAIEPITVPEEAKISKPVGEGLVGTWELTGGADEETQQNVELMLAFGMKMEFTFNADGTGSLYVAIGAESENDPFSYTVEDGQIVVDGNGMDYTLDGNTLILDMDGEGMVFTRK